MTAYRNSDQEFYLLKGDVEEGAVLSWVPGSTMEDK